MKQRKSIFLVVLAILLVFELIFVGCDNSTTTKKNPDPTDPAPTGDGTPPELPVLYDGSLWAEVLGDVEVEYDEDGGNMIIFFENALDFTDYSEIVIKLARSSVPGWIGHQFANTNVDDSEIGFWDDSATFSGGLLKLSLSTVNMEVDEIVYYTGANDQPLEVYLVE